MIGINGSPTYFDGAYRFGQVTAGQQFADGRNSDNTPRYRKILPFFLGLAITMAPLNACTNQATVPAERCPVPVVVDPNKIPADNASILQAAQMSQFEEVRPDFFSDQITMIPPEATSTPHYMPPPLQSNCIEGRLLIKPDLPDLTSMTSEELSRGAVIMIGSTLVTPIPGDEVIAVFVTGAGVTLIVAYQTAQLASRSDLPAYLSGTVGGILDSLQSYSASLLGSIGIAPTVQPLEGYQSDDLKVPIITDQFPITDNTGMAPLEGYQLETPPQFIDQGVFFTPEDYIPNVWKLDPDVMYWPPRELPIPQVEAEVSESHALIVTELTSIYGEIVSYLENDHDSPPSGIVSMTSEEYLQYKLLLVQLEESRIDEERWRSTINEIGEWQASVYQRINLENSDPAVAEMKKSLVIEDMNYINRLVTIAHLITWIVGNPYELAIRTTPESINGMYELLDDIQAMLPKIPHHEYLYRWADVMDDHFLYYEDQVELFDNSSHPAYPFLVQILENDEKYDLFQLSPTVSVNLFTDTRVFNVYEGLKSYIDNPPNMIMEIDRDLAIRYLQAERDLALARGTESEEFYQDTFDLIKEDIIQTILTVYGDDPQAIDEFGREYFQRLNAIAFQNILGIYLGNIGNYGFAAAPDASSHARWINDVTRIYDMLETASPADTLNEITNFINK